MKETIRQESFVMRIFEGAENDFHKLEEPIKKFLESYKPLK